MRVTMQRLGRVAVLAVVVALFSAPAALAQVAGGLQIETVDATGDVGWDSSLALDADGHPHISYFDETNDDLKYAVFDGTSWQIETVDTEGSVGVYSSLAFDSVGQPHISYIDAANYDLKYASFDGSVWQIETVDVSRNTGLYTSLALDAADQPHISYYDMTFADLKYAVFDGTSWQIERVDTAGNVGASTSLALDASGQPHISYFHNNNGDLKYATFDGSSWQIETVESAGVVGYPSSMVLDSAGQPHISYYDITNADLKYATFDGSTWQIETVDGTERAEAQWPTSALDIDSNGQPHISYWDGANGDLKYAAFDGSAWQIETVDADGLVGQNSSLVLDSQDEPHISYYDLTNGDLKYAHPGRDVPPTVEAGGPYSGSEGSPFSLQGAVSDPESDDLTTTWSHVIDSADPGTSCSFGDLNQPETTFSCTDDAIVTVTLEASDGTNPAVSDIATVTIANVAPAISDVIATMSGAQATVTVDANDPGVNDPLSYAFDCTNDGSFEVGSQTEPSTTCDFGNHEGTFTIGVQVSDDDGGIATDSVSVTTATELCASNLFGILRYSGDCGSNETLITIPDPSGPVTLCGGILNLLLRAPSTGACAWYETTYVLPDDGPLHVCVSNLTQTMRAVDDIAQCSILEFGRVIAAT